MPVIRERSLAFFITNITHQGVDKRGKNAAKPFEMWKLEGSVADGQIPICIVKMLAEVRALRESIIIADQLPTALASEVVKNTGLKIVHRLTAQDERQWIGTAISASSLQLERMASLQIGKAFIYHESTLKPFEIQVSEWKAGETVINPSSDAQLYQALACLPNGIRTTESTYLNWKYKTIDPALEAFTLLDGRYHNVVERNRDAEIKICLLSIEAMRQELQNIEAQCRRRKDLWFDGIVDDHPLKTWIQDGLSCIKSLITMIDEM